MMQLSVVIPVRDQAFPLWITLSWFAKRLPAESEIIVVDDGSTEDISQVVERFQDTMDVRLIRQESSRGRAAARNTGWRHATGDRILFNDADRFPAESHVAGHRDGEDIIYGGIREFYFRNPAELAPTLLDQFCNIQSRAREPLYPKVMFSHLFDSAGRLQSGLGWAIFMSGNVSVPRAALVDVGGFDEAFVHWGVEHFELGYRLAQLGLRFQYTVSSVNYHLAHPRETGFYREALQKSLEYFGTKHPDPVIQVFGEFLFGRAALQEVERANGTDGAWVYEHPTPVYFRGFASSVLATQKPEVAHD